jgi:hypothetical protein
MPQIAQCTGHTVVDISAGKQPSMSPDLKVKKQAQRRNAFWSRPRSLRNCPRLHLASRTLAAFNSLDSSKVIISSPGLPRLYRSKSVAYTSRQMWNKRIDTGPSKFRTSPNPLNPLNIPKPFSTLAGSKYHWGHTTPQVARQLPPVGQRRLAGGSASRRSGEESCNMARASIYECRFLWISHL